MLFFNKKKKQKLDPKVRFQNRQFNQKLQQARTFKRTTKPIPDSNVEKLLSRVGLGSRLIQVGVALLALGILYIIYAPNFLTLQNVTVEGLLESDRNLVQVAIRDSIGNAAFYNPQRNLLFLSTQRIKDASLSIPSVFKIEKIERDYKTKSLKVVVQAKHERFLVRSAEKVFDVYNDGTVKGLAGLDRNTWENIQNPNMAKIDIPANIKSTDSKEFISENIANHLIELQEQLKGITGSSFAYFSLISPQTLPVKTDQPSIEQQLAELEKEKAQKEKENEEEPPVEQEGKVAEAEPKPQEQPVPTLEIALPLSPEELNIVMQKGNDPKQTFRVIVDTKENPKQLVLRLSLLLSQTAPDRYNNLSYIDLRIVNRAYVCLLNTVCNN